MAKDMARAWLKANDPEFSKRERKARAYARFEAGGMVGAFEPQALVGAGDHYSSVGTLAFEGGDGGATIVPVCHATIERDIDRSRATLGSVAPQKKRGKRGGRKHR